MNNYFLKITLLVLALFFCLNTHAQQKIKLGNLEVAIDEIPLDKPYKVQFDPSIYDKKEQLFEQMIFASTNKKLFAMSAIKILRDSSNWVIDQEGFFDLYNSQGYLIWKYTEKDYYPVECLINDKKNIIVILWAEMSDVGGLELKCFNGKREIIFSDDNAAEIFSGENKSTIYYIKESDYTGNKENDYILFGYNIDTNTKWEKVIPSTQKINIAAISYDGKSLIVVADKAYLLNDKGEIKREFLYDKYPGRFVLSENGNFLFRLLKHETAELYNNLTGELIYTFTSRKIDQYDFTPNYACFVVEDEVIALCGSIAPYTALVAYFDKNNKLLGHHIIKSQHLHSGILIKNNDGIYSIFFDGRKVAEYEKEWE